MTLVTRWGKDIMFYVYISLWFIAGKRTLKAPFQTWHFSFIFEKVRRFWIFGAKIFGNVGSLPGNSIMVAKLKDRHGFSFRFRVILSNAILFVEWLLLCLQEWKEHAVIKITVDVVNHQTYHSSIEQPRVNIYNPHSIKYPHFIPFVRIRILTRPSVRVSVRPHPHFIPTPLAVYCQHTWNSWNSGLWSIEPQGAQALTCVSVVYFLVYLF